MLFIQLPCIGQHPWKESNYIKFALHKGAITYTYQMVMIAISHRILMEHGKTMPTDLLWRMTVKNKNIYSVGTSGA